DVPAAVVEGVAKDPGGALLRRRGAVGGAEGLAGERRLHAPRRGGGGLAIGVRGARVAEGRRRRRLAAAGNAVLLERAVAVHSAAGDALAIRADVADHAIPIGAAGDGLAAAGVADVGERAVAVGDALLLHALVALADLPEGAIPVAPAGRPRGHATPGLADLSRGTLGVALALGRGAAPVLTD